MKSEYQQIHCTLPKTGGWKEPCALEEPGEQDIAYQMEDFVFYSKFRGRPWRSFKEGSDVCIVIFKVTLASGCCPAWAKQNRSCEGYDKEIVPGFRVHIFPLCMTSSIQANAASCKLITQGN